MLRALHDGCAVSGRCPVLPAPRAVQRRRLQLQRERTRLPPCGSQRLPPLRTGAARDGCRLHLVVVQPEESLDRRQNLGALLLHPPLARFRVQPLPYRLELDPALRHHLGDHGRHLRTVAQHRFEDVMSIRYTSTSVAATTDAVRRSPVITPISPKTLGAQIRATSFSAAPSPRTRTSHSPRASTYSQCAAESCRVMISPRPNGAGRIPSARRCRSSDESPLNISICSSALTRCCSSRCTLRSRCSGSSIETHSACPGTASGIPARFRAT